jgi:RNA polymerase sigma factor (sigma-70 family)
MPTGHMNRLLTRLGRSALLHDGGGLGDGQLLARFLARRDGDAFTALLRRHGPMVLGVCRRLLGSPDDAEDAFQATWLVFVRKAASIAARESVGGWLYRVAYRTALEARAKRGRRRARERQVDDVPHPEVGPEEAWRELLPLLDREINRLPEKYRLAVVLCDLEGRTRREAARHLQIAEGTLSSRLTTARKALARRLARHGAILSAGGLAALLAQGTASAGVPGPLLLSTTKAAAALAAGPAATSGVISVKVAALTEGVMKAMFLAKLKVVSAVLCGVAVVGLGTGRLMYPARGQGGAPSGLSQAAAGGRRGSTEKARQEALPPAAETDRERALREQLEATRRELARLRDQVEMQRERAEMERRRAEEAARQALDQLKRAQLAEQDARRKAEQALYAENIGQAQKEFGVAANNLKQLPRQPGGPGVKLDMKRADLLKELDQRRAALLEELHRLDAKQKEMLAAIDQERQTQPRQPGVSPKRPGQAPPAADRLDRILQRLDRLERLLERLAPAQGPAK